MELISWQVVPPAPGRHKISREARVAAAPALASQQPLLTLPLLHASTHRSDRLPSESRRSSPEPRLVPRPPRPVPVAEPGRAWSAEAGVRPCC
jgi:hypothetical protein